ncbi:MAG: protein kinase [Chloroflexi bacterium]|nr:protein kinase [Chloroflexota bacterium]
MSTLNIGDQISHYEIIETIGSGGMATVYRARQLNFPREVAIKILRPERTVMAEFIQRFEREIQTVSKLHHKHIIQVFDHGEANNIIYLVTELLTGGSLSSLLEKGPLPPDKAEEILSQIAQALDYAHQRGVIHRDLKPQNILFNSQGQAILTDFGIAKVVSETTLTQKDMLMGTPAYMPPEQWQGRAVDERTDVYALGIILFEMLAGQKPFNASETTHWMHLHIYEPAPSIREFNPVLPREMEWIIEKALAKHPDSRFESAHELMTTFRAILKTGGMWTKTVTATFPAVPLEDDNLPTFKLNRHSADPTALEKPVQAALISPDQALEQEQRALEKLRAEMLRWENRSRNQFINPLPQDIQDRYTGRIREQDLLARSLREKTPLISVYGRGGVGKTALVCKVLADLQEVRDQFAPDGMVYLSYHGTGITLDRIFLDFSKLFSDSRKDQLEQVVRNPNLSIAEKSSLFLDALQAGWSVLLLDNLEPLQDNVTGTLIDAELQNFLEHCFAGANDSLTIIVTSREPLTVPDNLSGSERQIPLQEGLQVDDAIEFLRASDPDGKVGLRDASDESLIALTRKIRGFPRALEAIIGLLRETDTLQLADLLNEEEEDTLLESQITPNIVAHAIEQLHPSAIRVMEALALFGTPVGQSALEFLLSPYMSTAQVGTLLNRLTTSYFVSTNKVLGTYSLHPIDHDYCYQRIPHVSPENSYDRPSLHQRAEKFFQHQYQPLEECQSIEDLAPQLAGYDHLVKGGFYFEAAELLDIFDFDFMLIRGYYTQVIQLHQKLQGHLTDRKQARVSLSRMGNAYERMGYIDRAIDCYEAALKSTREDENLPGEASCLINLANIYVLQLGQLEKATDYFNRAMTISREIGHQDYHILALEGLGNVHYFSGDFEKALTVMHEVYDLSVASQNPNQCAAAANMASIYAQMGHLGQALEFSEQALVSARKFEYRYAEVAVLQNFGEVYELLGQFETALDHYQQARWLAQEIQNEDVEGTILVMMGNLYRRLGQNSAGMSHLQNGLVLVEKTNNIYSQYDARNGIAILHSLAGALDEASSEIEKSLLLAQPNNGHIAQTMRGIVALRITADDLAHSAFTEAIQLCDQLLARCAQLFKVAYIRAIAKAGLAMVEQRDFNEFLADYRQAQSICATPGVQIDVRQWIDLLAGCPDGDRIAALRETLDGNADNSL